METAFTLLVGVRHPLQQAVMGGVSGPELAGAVARAGALGMLWINRDLGTFEMASDRLRVVDILWSAPDAALVSRARRSGAALVGWQVGSLDEALEAVDAGCDFVVAQGREAGGHVRGTLPRQELLELVLSRVSVPVITTGGIATAGDVRAAIAEGAAAVRVGTRFVATDESNAHPEYVQALLAATSGDQTILTTAFGVGWPDAPHRVLASAVVAAEQLDGDVVGQVSGPDGPSPVSRFSVVTPSINTVGHIDAMALYAGTGVGAVTVVLPAAEVVVNLVSQLD